MQVSFSLFTWLWRGWVESAAQHPHLLDEEGRAKEVRRRSNRKYEASLGKHSLPQIADYRQTPAAKITFSLQNNSDETAHLWVQWRYQTAAKLLLPDVNWESTKTKIKTGTSFSLMLNRHTSSSSGWGRGASALIKILQPRHLVCSKVSAIVNY